MKHSEQKGSLRYFWMVYLFLCALAILYLGGLGMASEAEHRAAPASVSDEDAAPTEPDLEPQAISTEAGGQSAESLSIHSPADRPRHTLYKGGARSFTAATFRLIILIIFFLMLFTPFIPGIIELYWPKDDLPLYVDLDFIKDPRYFGKSFRRMIHNALLLETGPAPDTDAQGNSISRVVPLTLSKEEPVEICANRTVASHEQVANVMVVKGDLLVEESGVLLKEAKVFGNSVMKSKCDLRAVACDGDITLDPHVKVRRWIDAVGNILAGEECDLGYLASSENILTLDRKCRFRRLFANPIQTYTNGTDSGDPPPVQPGQPAPKQDGELSEQERRLNTIEDDVRYVKHDLTVEAQEVIADDLIVRGDLVAREGALFEGTVKVYGKAVLEKDVRIRGSLFAEQAVKMDEHCTIGGNVFCQGTVHLSEGCRIGREGKVKSVIGKKEIHLSADVVIHGYVLTEGEGRVL